MRIAAAQAASDALNELGLDQAKPVDPFVAIEEAGLVLRFWPLKDLLGATLPGSPGGILINSDRPASLQRYTAAHELGHWYMHQDVPSLDDEPAVLGSDHRATRELDAQVFAAHFLMPLELLYQTARRYGLKRGGTVGAEQVYQAARDMHVSYEAAVRQLRNTRFISQAQATQLLTTRPASIKQRLTGGMRLPNARGDIWLVEHSADHTEIEAFVGDAIVLRLTEHPASGYRWCAEETGTVATVHPLRRAPGPFEGSLAFPDEGSKNPGEIIPFPTRHIASDVVSLLRDEVLQAHYEPGSTPVGGTVTRLVAYTADYPGKESIRLNEIRHVRPDTAVSRLEVAALVRGLPDVEFRTRLLAAFARDESDAGDWDH